MKLRPIEFITAYMGASSLAEMASQTGMTKVAIHNRAKQYRDRGINLPTFKSDEDRATKQAEFISVYLASASSAEVAEKLGLTLSAVSHRACYLRGKGIDLPIYRRELSDVNKLNKLIDELKEADQ